MTDATTQTGLPFNDAVPGAVLETTKNGLVVAAEKLPELARYLRDQEGYDYLSMVTSVDWPQYFEVVYYLYRVGSFSLDTVMGRHGDTETDLAASPCPRVPASPEALVLKVRLADKAAPSVPSLISVWPGADLQEREVYDMMGIRFEGHPNLRRILLWDGFEGWPLRKDYKESYFEEDLKPFKTRHPDGQHQWAEDRVPWKDNITYPIAWDPDLFTQPTVQYRRIMEVDEPGNGDGADLKTERILLNLGPQHPSTHGVFRMVLALEGENVVGLEPEIGYLHRCHEKIGERNTYIMNMPFTDRLDYITSMSNNFGYALAVEKLMGLQVPERADYIRVIMAELTRVISHFIAVGFLFNDLGAYFTPALYGLRERELILDLFEAASGSRMMCNYMRFGGVMADLPAGLGRAGARSGVEPAAAGHGGLRKPPRRQRDLPGTSPGVGVLTAARGGRLQHGGPDAARIRRAVRSAPGRALFDLRPLRVRRVHPARGRRVGALPRADGRDLPEHPHLEAGARRHPGRADHAARQEAIPVQSAGRRSLRRGRGAEGRARLLRRQRRQGQSLPLSRARPNLHQPDQPGKDEHRTQAGGCGGHFGRD